MGGISSTMVLEEPLESTLIIGPQLWDFFCSMMLNKVFCLVAP